MFRKSDTSMKAGKSAKSVFEVELIQEDWELG